MRRLNASNFAYPFFLALLWMMVTDTLNLEGFILGYILSFFVIRILLMVQPDLETVQLPIPRLHWLVWYILKLNWEVLLSARQMLYWILNPHKIQAGIVAVELQDPDESPIIAALTAHNITVTMGQSVVAYDSTNKILYVHCLDVDKMAETIDAEQAERVRICRKVMGLD
jgi:multisubunit Na+/H+ antiporter MnhE subunit